MTRARSLGIPGGMGGWELVEADRMRTNVDRLVDEAIEIAAAKPMTPGIRDLVLTPSHLALTIHEIVAHATELDRVVGYEANYAGTSFVKVSDINKLKYGSKLFNVTGDKVRPGGRATVGYDDDGVKTTQFPIVRDGILVGLSSNRETAHYIGEKESRGCTQATTWRDYPFLRMPNVHMEPGPQGSPTPEQIIADTKDGVLIEGSGSFSIDQQRYNGQFGGGAFWEIKNGKKTRAVTNVTYNAITTDFWANLDAIVGPGILAAVRRRRRREGAADAGPGGLARRAVGADPADHGRRRRTNRAGAGHQAQALANQAAVPGPVPRANASARSCAGSHSERDEMKRRDFIKTVGVAGVAIASGDLIADLLAQSPKGQVLQSKFKGLADIALGEAKLEGCSYADVRFTMTAGIPGATASFKRR